ncbi:MAG: hypothetical protein J6W75_02070 [Bacteroidaceae bacterium]|nr:hypothetical protein [Bacteroidaceae bacterium]
MRHYLSIIFFSLLTASCMLSMEEWVVPEEEQGFEEPVTVENDYGTVTYQFNEGVLYVTDRVQEYIQLVEHDSILYFLDNVPSQWRPEVGMKLATGCSHKLPYGLNHRVLSVTDVGGMLKVVCTKVPLEDVYKELSYCIDAGLSYPAGIETLDSTELAALGFEMKDSVIMAWHVYDSIRGIKPVTRGDDEMEEVKVEQGVKTTKSEFINWTFDSRDILKAVRGAGKSYQAFKYFEDALLSRLIDEASEKNKTVGQKIKADIKPYAAFGLKITHFTSVHAEKDKARDYENNYTDTWTEVEGRLQAGVEYKKTSGENVTAKGIGTDPQTYDTGLHKWIQVTTSAGYKDLRADLVPNPKQSWNNAIIRFVFWAGPVPAAVIFTSRLSPEISIGGSVCVAGKLTTAKHRCGTITHDDKETKIDEDVEEGSFKFSHVSLDGHFKLGANYRAAAGFEIAGALAVTIGANVDAFLEGEGHIKVMDGTQPDGLFCFTPSGLVKFYVTFYGDVQLHVQPLGIHLWDKQLAKFWEHKLVDFSTKLQPDVYFVSGNCASSDGYCFGRAYYQLKSLGAMNGNYRPGMRMYLGPIKDGNYWQMVKDDDEVSGEEYGKAESKKTYYFKVQGPYEQLVDEVHFMPCLYTLDDDNNIEKELPCEDAEQVVEVGNPRIKTEVAIQTFGGRNSFDFSNSADNGVVYTEGGNGGDEGGGGQSIDVSQLNKFKILGRFLVLNGSRIKTWGIKVHIFNAKGKRILRRKIPINKCKSGVYSIVLSFLTNWEPPTASVSGDEGKLSYRITPYWSYESEFQRATIDEEAKDAISTTKFKLNYPVDDITPDFNSNKGYSSEWGEILPEKEL